jgi:hypothetical protein
LRVRDYLAYSNVEVGGGINMNAKFWRPAEIVDGVNLSLPYASWQNRLMLIFDMVSLRDDKLVSIPHWEDLRSCAIFRGLCLGELIDYTSQRVCGSVHNLRFYPGTSAVRDVFNMSLALVTNWCKYGTNFSLLGIRVDWTRNPAVQQPHFGGVPNAIADNGMMNRNRVVPGPNVWMIESRGSWTSCQSPDVKHLRKVVIPDWNRSDVVRFGNQTVYSSESQGPQISKIISMIDFQPTNVVYHFHNELGANAMILEVTNSTAAPEWLEWCMPLDRLMRGRITGAPLATVEGTQRSLAVPPDFVSYGRFNGFEAFAGSGGF